MFSREWIIAIGLKAIYGGAGRLIGIG